MSILWTTSEVSRLSGSGTKNAGLEIFADLFLRVLPLVLLGYCIGGRGFAYLGYPPLFVGELTLVLGVLAFACSRAGVHVVITQAAAPLMLVLIWGVCRTLPFVSEYGLLSVRDAMVWGYGIFAIIIAALIIERPERLRGMVERYRQFVPTFLLLIPVAFAVYRFIGETRFEWPWVKVPIVQVKEGDVLVHLGGCVAFWVAGLAGRVSAKWIILLAAETAIMGVIDRAGMVAFGAVFIGCVVALPKSGIVRRLPMVLVLTVLALYVTDVRIPVPGGKGRDISAAQIFTNITSIWSDSGRDGLDSTKEWRLNWWRDIVDYTVHGEYFWTGKGFGINLADDDGYQVNADKSLRNPHNVHFTILARAGVTGLVLWFISQAAWGWWMFLSYLQARDRGQSIWQGLFLFLTLYWMAFLINGSFDVFLEGPMGGIWFWTLYGVGIAAMQLYRTRPDVLDTAEDGPVAQTAGDA